MLAIALLPEIDGGSCESRFLVAEGEEEVGSAPC
jgi:hypothetical protein